MKQIKPHLCVDADIDKLRFPIMSLEKIDGCRLLHITGSATGRSLKPYANKFITNKFSDSKYAWFDGEITFGEITSESLCRDTTSVINTIKGEPEVIWNVFDYLHPDCINDSYIVRYTKLVDYVESNLKHDTSISVVPFKMVNSKEEVLSCYFKLLEFGFEGQILRDPEGSTKFGRATVKEGSYLRMKPQSDKEAICINLVEAMENQNEAKVNELGHTERSSHKENKVGKGMVGMLQCKDCETGLFIDIGAGCMTHEERIFYWNNPEKIVGEPIKYKSMDVGVKDKPRFARFISIRAKEDMS
jgi:DNA ligase-1